MLTGLGPIPAAIAISLGCVCLVVDLIGLVSLDVGLQAAV